MPDRVETGDSATRAAVEATGSRGVAGDSRVGTAVILDRRGSGEVMGGKKTKSTKTEKSFANQQAELGSLAYEIERAAYRSSGDVIRALPKMSGTIVVNRGVLIPLADAERLLKILKGDSK